MINIGMLVLVVAIAILYWLLALLLESVGRLRSEVKSLREHINQVEQQWGIFPDDQSL
jgi:hypothetical protein